MLRLVIFITLLVFEKSRISFHPYWSIHAGLVPLCLLVDYHIVLVKHVHLCFWLHHHTWVYSQGLKLARIHLLEFDFDFCPRFSLVLENLCLKELSCHRQWRDVDMIRYLGKHLTVDRNLLHLRIGWWLASRLWNHTFLDYFGLLYLLVCIHVAFCKVYLFLSRLRGRSELIFFVIQSWIDRGQVMSDDVKSADLALIYKHLVRWHV